MPDDRPDRALRGAAHRLRGSLFIRGSSARTMAPAHGRRARRSATERAARSRGDAEGGGRRPSPQPRPLTNRRAADPHPRGPRVPAESPDRKRASSSRGPSPTAARKARARADHAFPETPNSRAGVLEWPLQQPPRREDGRGAALPADAGGGRPWSCQGQDDFQDDLHSGSAPGPSPRPAPATRTTTRFRGDADRHAIGDTDRARQPSHDRPAPGPPTTLAPRSATGLAARDGGVADWPATARTPIAATTLLTAGPADLGGDPARPVPRCGGRSGLA